MRVPVNGSAVPKIIVISSDSHQGSSFIDYEEFGIYKDYGVSKGMSNYSYFKLVLNTWAVELSRRFNKDKLRTSINIICPGPVHSNIIREAPWLLRVILKSIFSIVFKSPADAAKAVIYMALSPDYESKTGEYLHMFNPKHMDERCTFPRKGKNYGKPPGRSGNRSIMMRYRWNNLIYFKILLTTLREDHRDLHEYNF